PGRRGGSRRRAGEPAAERGAVSARARARAVAGALTVTAVLVGCAAPDLERGRAEDLQDGVLAVTQAAAGGQYDAAAQAVVALRAELEDAVEQGQVSATRYLLIDDALDCTELELAATRDAQLAAEEAA